MTRKDRERLAKKNQSTKRKYGTPKFGFGGEPLNRAALMVQKNRGGRKR